MIYEDNLFTPITGQDPDETPAPPAEEPEETEEE